MLRVVYHTDQVRRGPTAPWNGVSIHTCALLALDDFGLKPLPPSGPEDLYDIINERFLARTSERGYLVWTPKAGTQTTPKMPRSDLSAWAFLIVVDVQF